MSERIEWSETRWGGNRGKVGGLSLFSIHWGTKRQEHMWQLETTLPANGPSIGQVHASREDAMAAAERFLAAFIKRISPATGDDA